GDALRALPSATPPASAWPELAAKLAVDRIARPAEIAHRMPTSPRRASAARRFALPAALAAAIALSLVATLPLRSPAPAPDATAMRMPATNSALVASSVHNAANATNSTAMNDASENLATLQSRSH